jgi:hypothetical protein
MISSPQKLATPTFQVPFCSTAVPVWFFSSGVPLTRISYFTVAWVGEVTVTLVTLAVASDARLEPDWLLMTDANVGPSWSSVTRLLSGVLALKKASQFAVIAAIVAALALDEVPAEAAGDDEAGDVAAGEEVPAGDDEPADVGLPPPQAARVTVRAASADAPSSCEMCL